MVRKRTIPRSPSASSAPPATRGGVTLGAAPDTELPELPHDLTLLSDQDLMILFGDYVAWQNYAATRFSEAEVTEARAEAAVKYQEDIVMMGAVEGQILKTRAALSSNKAVVEAREDQMNAYAIRKTTAVVLANCERVVNLVSRELSRRIAESPTERRNNRWNP
jgi:hypothetical protein